MAFSSISSRFRELVDSKSLSDWLLTQEVRVTDPRVCWVCRIEWMMQVSLNKKTHKTLRKSFGQWIFQRMLNNLRLCGCGVSAPPNRFCQARRSQRSNPSHFSSVNRVMVPSAALGTRQQYGEPLNITTQRYHKVGKPASCSCSSFSCALRRPNYQSPNERQAKVVTAWINSTCLGELYCWPREKDNRNVTRTRVGQVYPSLRKHVMNIKSFHIIRVFWEHLIAETLRNGENWNMATKKQMKG